MVDAYKYIKSLNIKKNDYVVIATSGGPDSMALLHLLLTYKEQKEINVVCAHVNHNVRIESKEEQKFLKDYCKKHNILFESMIIEHYRDDNFHNEARTIRYNFFQTICNKYNAKYLFTAHHGDDLMETILMRMVRGSTLKGYSGFKRQVTVEKYTLVRPLITLTKEDIINYNEKNNIPYVIDKSNMKDTYTRNRYRKYVLPFLKNEDENVHHKFYKFSQLLLEYDSFVEKTIKHDINVVYTQNSINIDKLKEKDEIIKNKIINYILENLYQDDLILINDKHVNLIFDLINSTKANTYVYLPNNIKAIKAYNQITFTHDKDENEVYEMELNDYVCLPNGHTLEIVKNSNLTNNNVCHLSSKEITLPIYVRNRKVGDKMQIKGMTGNKKIKDIFIDEKIDMSKRKLWPIVVDAKGTIVFLPGLKKSKFDKQKDENYDIIIKYD